MLGSVCLASDMTIADAKQLKDDVSVTLSAKVITYTGTGFFYIEEDTKSMGIKVEKPTHGLKVGMRVDVTGTIETDTSRERYILADSAVQTAAPNATGTIASLGMSNGTVGGGPWCVSGTGGQVGITKAAGLNNIGLLIKTWGKFRKLSDTTFSIDDGSGSPIQCTVPTGTFLYSGWQYVVVTGISSISKYSATTYPSNILVRDIDVLQPVEAVSTPGTPSGNTNPDVNVTQTYSTTESTCSQGHTVEYSFNWGDGTSTDWSTSTSASHSWSTTGEKAVTVTARCQAHNCVTATSAPLTVNPTQGSYTGEMIYIPAGNCLIGTNNTDYRAEYPQHSVYLSDYYIGKYEVTRGEYRAFMNAGGYSNAAYWSSDGWNWKVSKNKTEPEYWSSTQLLPDGPVYIQTDSSPVIGVTYYEAEAFCNWAGGHLPTETQWEKAAGWTGSCQNLFPWGDTWDREKCNNFYDQNIAGGGYCAQQPAPVGSYLCDVSSYGCYDMAGNVMEWCQDWYKTYTGCIDPIDYTNIYRVIRGSSWEHDEYCARCTFRTYGDMGAKLSYIGFRMAR